METPVVLLLYNRPEKTARVFAEIARARPRTLLLVADGPRAEHEKDVERCEAARRIATRVDWDCDVRTNFAESNMGCRNRISTGLEWVFGEVEEAIILEDDCVPHPSFFPFCEELLARYRDDARVSMISGNNFQFGRTHTSDSYTFSRYTHVWGWATWRRAWRGYDVTMQRWPELRRTQWLRGTLDDRAAAAYWRTYFDLIHAGRIDTWDYQWTYSMWLQDGLSATPVVNLVSNIGFDEEATHTKHAKGLQNVEAAAMEFPLRHPREVRANRDADRFAFRNAIALDEVPRTLMRRIRDRVLPFPSEGGRPARLRARRSPSSLYICYLGLLEPLVQTQVLPYLRELAAGGTRMHILTFEPELRRRWSASMIATWRERLRAEGIEWHLLPYHKRFTGPATLFDIAAGTLRVIAIVRRERIDILHGRGHVGAAIASIAKKFTRTRVIFDIRGFLPEEYVDSGNWSESGYLYRWTKAAEKWLFRSADGFVVLTARAKETLFPDGVPATQTVEVIPCCVSRERFASALELDRDALRRDLGLAGRRVFVYLGALSGYYLLRETAELLGVAREQWPETYVLVLTQTPAPVVAGELERAGLTADDYAVRNVAPEDVPRYLRAADVALALMRPSYPRRSMSPTKFAEYLAAGLPVIVAAGIGDLDAEVEQGGVGVLLRRFDRGAYEAALREMDELLRDPALEARCRAHALRFDLHTVGGERYRRLYRALQSFTRDPA